MGVTGALAAAFHIAQNRYGLTGGGIAWAKSLWLGLTILFWFVLPALVVADVRLSAVARRPFAWLLALMAVRAVGEGWMLYISHSWSPLYGIAHDALCAAVLWAGAIALARHRGTAGPLGPTMIAHCIVTGLLFLPEIGYAAYMRAHFTTAGEQPIYFVPDESVHAVLLRVTAGVDLLALAYLAWFLHAWLHAQPRRQRS